MPPDDDDFSILGYGILAIALTLWLLFSVAAIADPATVAWVFCTVFCS